MRTHKETRGSKVESDPRKGSHFKADYYMSEKRNKSVIYEYSC